MLEKYIIVSRKLPFFPLVIGELILLPLFCYLQFPIVGIPGEIVLFIFWLLSLLGVFFHIKGYKNRVEISENGISFYKGNVLINLGWDEINELGFQVSVAKRIWIYEGIPYLALNLIDSSRDKLNLLSSSNEFGFIQKKNDFDKYLAKEKLDLYVSMKMTEDKDSGLINLLSSKSGFKKNISPLVKTSDQAEYAKVIKNNFTL